LASSAASVPAPSAIPGVHLLCSCCARSTATPERSQGVLARSGSSLSSCGRMVVVRCTEVLQERLCRRRHHDDRQNLLYYTTTWRDGGMGRRAIQRPHKREKNVIPRKIIAAAGERTVRGRGGAGRVGSGSLTTPRSHAAFTAVQRSGQFGSGSAPPTRGTSGCIRLPKNGGNGEGRQNKVIIITGGSATVQVS